MTNALLVNLQMLIDDTKCFGLCCKNLLRTENSLEKEVVYAITPAYLVDEEDPFSDGSFLYSYYLSFAYLVHNLIASYRSSSRVE